MRLVLTTLASLACCVLAGLLGPVSAEEGADALGPVERVFVPVDELDLLIRSQREGIVLDHDKFQDLLAKARKAAAGYPKQAPVGAVFVAAEGTLRVDGATDTVVLDATYTAHALAAKARPLHFTVRGLALEHLGVPEGGQFSQVGAYGRLVLPAAGTHELALRASTRVARKGGMRLVDIQLPSAAAMRLWVEWPASMRGSWTGAGAPTIVGARIQREGDEGAGAATTRFLVRPAVDGRLRLAFEPARRTTSSAPPTFDVRIAELHHFAAGRDAIQSHVDLSVYRAPASHVDLDVPADYVLRQLEGPAVLASERSEDRRRLRVRFQEPVRGATTLLVHGERPITPARGLRVEGVRVAGSLRHQSTLGLSCQDPLAVEDIRVQGGRRLAKGETLRRDVAAGKKRKAPPKASAPAMGDETLRFHLLTHESALVADLMERARRLEARSTTYLNLAETGKTLLYTAQLSLAAGRVHRLQPHFPPGYELVSLTLNGKPTQFMRAPSADGRVEVPLLRGLRPGETLQLAARLELADVAWLPDGTVREVPLMVPRAGVDREDGVVGVGADAAFDVRERMHADLRPLGAAVLREHGIRGEGLLFGYRVEGEQPRAQFDVLRRTSVVSAELVTTLSPSPRRLDVSSVVVHDIRRAGLRSLTIDVPSWSGRELRMEGAHVRSHAPRAAQAGEAPVPAGYGRHEVTLDERVIGRHSFLVRYTRKFNDDAWQVAPDEPLLPHVPLRRVRPYVVVARATDLEVALDAMPAEGADALRHVEPTELPDEAPADPAQILHLLNVPAGHQGLALSVVRHPGAAVLDALAQVVLVDTAVAREGVLRSRATIQLRNAGRQQLAVQLPAGSHLVGALVRAGEDEGAWQAVKPLRSPSGIILVPLGRTGGGESATYVALTYQTDLGGSIHDSFEVEAPRFPGLEVLRTFQRVALDGEQEVASVSGDFGSFERPIPRRTPWIAELRLRSDSAGASSAPTLSAPAGTDKGMPKTATSGGLASPQAGGGGGAGGHHSSGAGAAASAPRPDEDVERFSGGDEIDGLVDAPFHMEDTEEVHEQELVLEASNFDLPPGSKKRAEAAQRWRTERVCIEPATENKAAVYVTRRVPVFAKPGGAVWPGQRDPSDPSPPPPPSGPPSSPPPAKRPSPEPTPGDSEYDHMPGNEEAAGGRGRSSARRRGLLSLDVPVVLGPRRMRASRMGQGGSMRIALRSPQTAKHWHAGLFGLALLVLLGLSAKGGGSLHIRLALLGCGVLVALAIHGLLDGPGHLVAVALIDALTTAALTWLLLGLARWMLRSRRAVAAAALVALVGGSVGDVHAAPDDKRAPPPEGDAVPGVPARVFVPYERSDEWLPDTPDRVYLPFDSWRRLLAWADPSADPRTRLRGWSVTLRDVAWHVTVGEQDARGHLDIHLHADGSFPRQLAIPVGGIAITSAHLSGKPVEFLHRAGAYHVEIPEAGTHKLCVAFRMPVLQTAAGSRQLGFRTLPALMARLILKTGAFEGDIEVARCGRVISVDATSGERVDQVALGPIRDVRITLTPPRPATLPGTVRARAETRTVHSLRDGGTETEVGLALFVTQGEAPFVDLRLPEGCHVLEAHGVGVQGWHVRGEVPERVLRLRFEKPRRGKVEATVRVVRAHVQDAREEHLPVLSVLGVTSERGAVVLNAPPHRRAEVLLQEGLFRVARPRDPVACGRDQAGEVLGAWRYSKQPVSLRVATHATRARLHAKSAETVLFGGDRMQCAMDIDVAVRRGRIGKFTFDLPGVDEVRDVRGPQVESWWLSGTGETRQLHVRLRDLVRAATSVPIHVELETLLRGRLEGIDVPRIALQGAEKDEGTLALWTHGDVDPVPGGLPGLRLLGEAQAPTASGRVRTHQFVRERPLSSALPVVLRRPVPRFDATVVGLVVPGESEHRLEELLLVDVRRGALAHIEFFVPDAGAGGTEDVRADDVREIRRQRVTRSGSDGADVQGTAYRVSFQTPRRGLIALTLTRMVQGGMPVRWMRPQGAEAERWFSVVQTYVDGEVDARPVGGRTDTLGWEDLPVQPAGVTQSSVVGSWVGREPYALALRTIKHRLEAQAGSVVLSAHAHVVVGRDGEARTRLTYRLFNRQEQVLRVRLPAGSTLFGARADGRSVKPLRGEGDLILLAIPKVPLGGAGYPVTLLYRTRVGPALEQGAPLRVVLPKIEGAEIERTVVRLHLPDGHDYDLQSTMDEVDAQRVLTTLAEAAVQEARQLMEVAESGTLAQRQEALRNGSQLLEEATRLSEVAPAKGTRTRSQARGQGSLPQLPGAVSHGGQAASGEARPRPGRRPTE